MSDITPQSKGGKARSEALSPERRKEIEKASAGARSMRVVSQRGLGVTRGGPRDDMRPDQAGAELPRFATQNWLLPHLSNDLQMALRNPILFSAPRVFGYRQARPLQKISCRNFKLRHYRI